MFSSATLIDWLNLAVQALVVSIRFLGQVRPANQQGARLGSTAVCYAWRRAVINESWPIRG